VTGLVHHPAQLAAHAERAGLAGILAPHRLPELPDTAHLARSSRVDAIEPIEDVWQERRWYALAGVSDSDVDGPVSLRDGNVNATAWRRDIERLAARPNVNCKISGTIARVPKQWSADDLAPIINNCLEKDRELRYQSAADLRADVKHGRFVAFAFANHHAPAHRHRVHYFPHCLDSHMIGKLSVTLSHCSCCRDRRGLGYAQEIQRQLALCPQVVTHSFQGLLVRK